MNDLNSYGRLAFRGREADRAREKLLAFRDEAVITLDGTTTGSMVDDLSVVLCLTDPDAREDLRKLPTGEKAFFAVVRMTREVLGSGVW